jgi:8-oxo-dGTP pyrophosphatase MutT (NUDIX family)
MPQERSAGAIIFFIEKSGEAKYLLLKHKPDSWDFPKGLIEKGEKPEEAAIRECKEETGIEINELIPGFKETIRFFFKVKYPYQVERGFKMGQAVLKFVTYFLARAQTKDVKISFEHEDYEWLGFDDLVNRLKKRKESQNIIKKANEYILGNKI